jgi:hypothetical protein
MSRLLEENQDSQNGAFAALLGSAEADIGQCVIIQVAKC